MPSKIELRREIAKQLSIEARIEALEEALAVLLAEARSRKPGTKAERFDAVQAKIAAVKAQP